MLKKYKFSAHSKMVTTIKEDWADLPGRMGCSRGQIYKTERINPSGSNRFIPAAKPAVFENIP